MHTYKYLSTVMILSLTLLYSFSGFSQSGSLGNTFIGAGGEMTVIADQHNFLNGGNGVLPGMVGTERTSPQGFFSFAGAATYVGASDNAFVDGYVKTYKTSSFIFPIGDNNKYRPAAVSAASSTSPASAAYFGVSPSTAITSSLKGGNEPALPTGAPFSTASVGSGVNAVSTTEYWDINGATAAKITLTWNANSGINTLTGGTLSKLTIVGWNGSQWVRIASAVDATSILGSSSTTSDGSITTTNSIVPDTYTAYSFGVAGDAFSIGNATVSQTASPNDAKSGSAATDLAPSGGTQPYVYSNGSSDPACVAPGGATALPASSNLVVNSNGTYSYTAPTTPGKYYFCIKVCDSSTPANCAVAAYTITVSPACNAGTVAPILVKN